MRHTLKILALGICANALIAAPVSAQPAAEVTLTRLSDCGTNQAPTEVNLRFSDTYSLGSLKTQFVFSCYLITIYSRHRHLSSRHPGGT